MADKSNNLSDVLLRAKLSLDEAIVAAVSELSPADLKRLRAQDDTNTSCTNTGCGKSQLAEASIRE
jgi:hypothetical protein